jgi:hypothetical protein
MTNLIMVVALFTNCSVTEVKFENYCRITTVVKGYYRDSSNTTNKQVWDQWQTNVVYKTNVLSIVPATNKQTDKE